MDLYGNVLGGVYLVDGGNGNIIGSTTPLVITGTVTSGAVSISDVGVTSLPAFAVNAITSVSGIGTTVVVTGTVTALGSAATTVSVASLPSFAVDAITSVSGIATTVTVTFPSNTFITVTGSALATTSIWSLPAFAVNAITSISGIGTTVITTFPASTFVTVTGSAFNFVQITSLPPFPVSNVVTVTGTALGFWQKSWKSITTRSAATISLIAAVATKKLKIYSFDLITEGNNPTRISFSDGLSTGTALATYSLQAFSSTNFGVAKSVAPPSFLFATTAGNPLEMTFSGTNVTLCNLNYWDDDAA